MKPYFPWAAALVLTAGLFARGQNYDQINLVANRSGIAHETDPHLVNPWGLARTTGSDWWVADAGTGLSTIYRGDGLINSLVVAVPKANPGAAASTPTGMVSDLKFLASAGNPASFLFCTAEGSIAGWNPETGLPPGGSPPSKNAVTLVKTTDGSSYLGLTSATIGAHFYLYAANFSKGRIDVYSTAYKRVTLPKVPNLGDFNPGTTVPFTDALLPKGYTPFNVQAIGNDLVVTYALSNGAAGPGKGFVDIYSSAGELLMRFEHGAWMNAPWGVALAPTDFGTFSHHLLIGQFGEGSSTAGSGTIASFDLVTGKFTGLLKDANGKPITIDGLWALGVAGGVSSGSVDAFSAPAAELYFTAGPNHGKDGLFGYLTAVSLELIEGDDQ